jgi:hypothetical protein
MLSRLFRRHNSNNVIGSKLYDNNTFYRALEKDILSCQHEAVIENPFITMRRLKLLMPFIQSAKLKGVNVVVNTKSPEENEDFLRLEAKRAVDELQETDVKVLFTGGHHRKLAIFDRRILWEGSLNILSQNDSCEIMRRADSSLLAEQMIHFLELERFLI